MGWEYSIYSFSLVFSKEIRVGGGEVIMIIEFFWGMGSNYIVTIIVPYFDYYRSSLDFSCWVQGII